MKNIYRKIFLITIISFLIIPQVTFAAWWNPISWNIWKIFNRQNSETQILENVINKPEQTPEDVINMNTPIKNDEENKAKLEAEKKAKNARSEALRADEERLRFQQIESARLMEEVRQVQLKLQAIEQEAKRVADIAAQEAIQKEEQKTLSEEPKKTTLNVREITCTLRPAGEYYLIPFTVDGEWVSGWVQVKIKDEYGGTVTKGLDLLDKSNINDGFIFGKTGRTYDSYGGSRSVELKAGLKGTYQIRIHSVAPRYVGTIGGRVSPTYSASSLVAEESGEFSLPDC